MWQNRSYLRQDVGAACHTRDVADEPTIPDETPEPADAAANEAGAIGPFTAGALDQESLAKRLGVPLSRFEGLGERLAKALGASPALGLGVEPWAARRLLDDEVASLRALAGGDYLADIEINDTPERTLEATERTAASLTDVVAMLAQQRDLMAEQRDIAIEERDAARADRAAADERARLSMVHSWWALAGTWIAVVVAVVALIIGT